MAQSTPIPEETGLHNKYRPRTLDRVLGHEVAVAKLRSVVETGKWPSALAFFGPTSAGKTTLAYALGCSALGVNKVANGVNPDFYEIVGTDSKTIDDVRNLISISKMRPQNGLRRFILVDEAQGLLAGQGAAALLGALERPPKSTTWILTSMSPDKFGSTDTGRAIANRCIQFHLKAPSDEVLYKQARRIAKGEGFLNHCSAELLKTVASSCNRELRTLANLMQDVQMYLDGLAEAPEEPLGPEILNEVMSISATQDDALAVKLMISLLTGKKSAAMKYALQVEDGFSFVGKLISINFASMSDRLLKGVRNKNVWVTAASKAMSEQLEEAQIKYDLQWHLHNRLLALKTQAAAFIATDAQLLAGFVASFMLPSAE